MHSQHELDLPLHRIRRFDKRSRHRIKPTSVNQRPQTLLVLFRTCSTDALELIQDHVLIRLGLRLLLLPPLFLELFQRMARFIDLVFYRFACRVKSHPYRELFCFIELDHKL
jgi:hypothetical protein